MSLTKEEFMNTQKRCINKVKTLLFNIPIPVKNLNKSLGEIDKVFEKNKRLGEMLKTKVREDYKRTPRYFSFNSIPLEIVWSPCLTISAKWLKSKLQHKFLMAVSDAFVGFAMFTGQITQRPEIIKGMGMLAEDANLFLMLISYDLDYLILNYCNVIYSTARFINDKFDFIARLDDRITGTVINLFSREK